MNLIKRLGITVLSIYGLFFFVVLLLLLLPLFFAASFFGRIRGGNMFYKLCSWWADAWLFLIGIRSKIIHEEKLSEQRPCIFVANHSSYMDIPMLVKVIREPVRVLGKVEMAGIPIFGFVYKNAVVLVNRNNAAHRSRSVSILKRVLNRGVSIFIFPEGTFNLTTAPLKEFYDGAFRIAIETETPIQPLIFPDTVKRLHHNTVFSLSPGLSRAVFLPMIETNGLSYKNMGELKQRTFEMMSDALQRYQRNGQ